MILDAYPERTLWMAVLRQAVRDALATPSVHLAASEICDARDFLLQPERLGDLCEALGLSVAWTQVQLRQQYPTLFVIQETQPCPP